jgi:hypothetical protein
MLVMITDETGQHTRGIKLANKCMMSAAVAYNP